MALRPVTVKLTRNYTDFGKPVTAVTIDRELNGNDLLAADGKGKYEQTLVFIHRLTGLSWKTTLELSMRDVSAIEDAMAPFAGMGPLPASEACGDSSP